MKSECKSEVKSHKSLRISHRCFSLNRTKNKYLNNRSFCCTSRKIATKTWSLLINSGWLNWSFSVTTLQFRGLYRADTFYALAIQCMQTLCQHIKRLQLAWKYWLNSRNRCSANISNSSWGKVIAPNNLVLVTALKWRQNFPWSQFWGDSWRNVSVKMENGDVYLTLSFHLQQWTVFQRPLETDEWRWSFSLSNYGDFCSWCCPFGIECRCKEAIFQSRING